VPQRAEDYGGWRVSRLNSVSAALVPTIANGVIPGDTIGTTVRTCTVAPDVGPRHGQQVQLFTGVVDDVKCQKDLCPNESEVDRVRMKSKTTGETDPHRHRRLRQRGRTARWSVAGRSRRWSLPRSVGVAQVATSTLSQSPSSAGAGEKVRWSDSPAEALGENRPARPQNRGLGQTAPPTRTPSGAASPPQHVDELGHAG
jgi:hypothetical protein